MLAMSYIREESASDPKMNMNDREMKRVLKGDRGELRQSL